MTTSTLVEPAGLRHAALFYRSDEEYLGGIVPFVIDGLEKNQPVMAALPPNKLAVLRDALGNAAAAVMLADVTEIARNPSRILVKTATFADKYPDRRVRVVGEPLWPGRSDDEYQACVQMEALCNKLLERRAVTGMCAYNAGQLDGRVLADTRTTHPLLWQGGSAERSADYAPYEAIARYNQPLTNCADAAVYLVTTYTDLSAARAFAERYARTQDLSADGISDLQLIATELATNSLEHTGRACRLAFWVRSGNLICEASDSGRFDDPLAGYRVPAGDALDGRGLFLVNALADLVRTHSSASGTTIQAYLRLDKSPRVVT